MFTMYEMTTCDVRGVAGTNFHSYYRLWLQQAEGSSDDS